MPDGGLPPLAESSSRQTASESRRSRRRSSPQTSWQEVEARVLQRTSLHQISPEEMSVGNVVEEKSRYIINAQRDNDKAHARCEDDALRLIHALHAASAARVMDTDMLEQRAKSLQATASDVIRRARNDRGANEVELQHAIVERVAEARGVLEEHVRFNQLELGHSGQIREEICNIYRFLEEERKVRAEKGGQMAQAVRQKLDEVREAVVAERRIRLESQDTLLELFGQMGERLHRTVQGAKHDRQMASERIFQVMEKVVPKLDSASRMQALVKSQVKLEENGGDGMSMANAAGEMLKRRVSVGNMGGASLLIRTGQTENMTRQSGPGRASLKMVA